MAENLSIPEIGDEIKVAIESIAFGGDGVARHGNYVLFVPDVIPGEQVMVRVSAAKKSFGRALPLEILAPSPDRTEPRCAVYGTCGGCQYQHVSYARSLEFKEGQIREVMLRIGGLEVEEACAPIVPSPEAFGYRNSVSLRLRRAGDEWQAGYTGRDNKTFVPVSCCPLAADEVNHEIENIGSGIRRLESTDKIRGITVRGDGERTLLCPRYVRPLRFTSEARLCYLHEHLGFYYGCSSFFQVNHHVIPALLDLVKEGLNPKSGQTLLDLYAGVGLFSIALAEEYSQVVGVEVGQEAVECFEENLRENAIENVTVVRAAVEDSIRSGLRELEKQPVSVLADPPREGMKPEVARALNEGPVERLVYVSCDPATLARDLKLLGTAFTLKKLTPLDMFPQTKHIEAVAVLVR